MKRLLLVLALTVIGLSWKVSAVTTQPTSLGLVTAIIESKTLAQVNTTVPLGAGQLVYCTDCVRATLCVSSGTARGAFTIVAATGTFVGGLSHCQ